MTGIRVLLQLLPHFQEHLIQRLSQQLNAEIHVGNIHGDVIGFLPQITLENTHIASLNTDDITVDISSAVFKLNPWESLITLQPRLDSLYIDGTKLSIDTADLKHNNNADASTYLTPLTGILQTLRKVKVVNSHIDLHKGNTARSNLGISIEFHREDSRKQFSLHINKDSESVFTLEGDGFGNPIDPNDFTGEVYGKLSIGPIEDIAQLVSDTQLSGTADVSFWYQVYDSDASLLIHSDIEKLSMTMPGSDAPITLNQLSTNGLLRPTKQGWSITLADTVLHAKSAVLNLERMQVATRGKNLQFNAIDFDVASTVQVLIASGMLTGKALQIASGLSPSGRIKALEINLEDFTDPLAVWSATMEVEDASTQPLKKIPGFYKIDASFEINQNGAIAWIDAEDSGLNLPKVYRHPLHFDQIRGHLSARWQPGKLFLEDGFFAVSGPEHSAMIQLGMDISLEEESNEYSPLAIFLGVGFQDVNVSIRRRYIPHTIDTDLYHWLDNAISKGQINSGAFIFRADLDNTSIRDQSMQLDLELTDSELAFQADWPTIEVSTTRVLVDTNNVNIWGDSGIISGLQLNSLSAKFNRDSRVDSIMQIHSDVSGEIGDAIELLRNSPVTKQAGTFLSDIEAEGRVAGKLNLQLDLNDLNGNPNLDLTMNLSASTLRSQSLDLAISDINGNIDFTLNDGFSADALTATLFGQPVDIVIGAGTTGLPDTKVLDAHFTGQVQVADIIDWIGRTSDLAPMETLKTFPVKGAANVAVDIAVGKEVNFRIRSDLVGIALNLPEPIGKSAEAQTPFQMQFAMGDTHTPWEVFWHRRFQGQFYRQDNQFSGASIDLTPRREASKLVNSPLTNDGIYITGHLPLIELEPWLAAWDNLDTTDKRLSSKIPITVDQLVLQTVIFRKTNIGPLNINKAPFETWDILKINSEWLDAELALRNDGSPSILTINNLDFDRLHDFAISDAEETIETALTMQPEKKLSPPKLAAPLAVNITNIHYHGMNLGAVAFTMTSEEDVLEATNIRGNLAEAHLLNESQLVWQRGEDDNFTTTLLLNSNIANLSDSFQALGIEPVLNSKSGHLQTNLSWPGAPIDIDLTALSGKIYAQFYDGSFLPLPTNATGFIRIFSILNLAGLFERANVIQLFEPGVTFKKAQGELLLQPGKLQVSDFTVDSQGGDFHIDSDIDLVADTIDGELVATLPLADNIPWATALTGALPLAAGLYLASKVFKEQVELLSSGVYSISGPLSHPDVKLIRIFDSTKTKQ